MFVFVYGEFPWVLLHSHRHRHCYRKHVLNERTSHNQIEQTIHDYWGRVQKQPLSLQSQAIFFY